MTQSERGQQGLNKKRQQLSDQLKQISVKIDQEIHELRKQSIPGNASTNSSLSKRRQSFGGPPALSSRIKTQQTSIVLKSSRETINQAKCYNSKDSVVNNSKVKESINKVPKVHTGPFNTQCIFMQSAKCLLDKITSLLVQQNMKYQQTDRFCISVGGGPQVTVQSIQGVAGLHLITFQGQHPLNHSII